jgi:HlyD family secretion protein
MLTQKQTLFREKSLERLSSPERLDQLMEVVNPKSWLPLLSLTSLVAAAGLWSIYGRIPITIEGRGVLVYPSNVVPLQSKNSGQLSDLTVEVGDTVKKGQILGTINQTELQKQLQQQRTKLAQLQSQNQAVSSLQALRIEQEKHSIQQQRQYLQQRIQELQSLTPLLKTTSNESLKQQRQSLQQRLQHVQGMTPIYQQRLDIRQQLFAERVITHDVLLDAQVQVQENQDTISKLQTQLTELDVTATEQEKAHRDNLSTIANLRSQLQALESRQANLAQEDLEAVTLRQKEIQAVQRDIAQLEVQLNENSQIISPHSGRIVELAVNTGQVVNPGTRLGTLDAANPDSEMVGITYFSVGDGKKIKPGMTLQITPQTVKRERFGGIVGAVKDISTFPITQAAAAKVVGNPEIVADLVSNQPAGLMQVVADLHPDSTTFSGYKWSSSKGPELNISSGTTTTVRVTIEERAPITFILPILRSSSGIY